jgi:hypothetical protein
MQDERGPELRAIIPRARARYRHRRLAFALALITAGGVGVLATRLVKTEDPPPVDLPVIAPDDPLGCAAPDPTSPSDEPIGTSITREGIDQIAGVEHPLHVVASSQSSHIAVHHEGGVFISDDDGRTFRRAFAGFPIHQIAIDHTGVLYVRWNRSFGIRTPDGVEQWRYVSPSLCFTYPCADRIAVVGDQLVWLHDDQVSITSDRGETWVTLPTGSRWQRWSRVAEADLARPTSISSLRGTRLFAWRGALYQIDHHAFTFHDSDGVNDYPTWRLDLSSLAVSQTTFHDSEQLLASSDAASSWSWRDRCGGDPDEPGRPCMWSALKQTMLVAKTLFPAEGARTLAVFDGSLIEVCAKGARRISRDYPFERVDAVDWVGRPIVVRGNTVLRWGAHGWRRLYTYQPRR